MERTKRLKWHVKSALSPRYGCRAKPQTLNQNVGVYSLSKLLIAAPGYTVHVCAKIRVRV